MNDYVRVIHRFWAGPEMPQTYRNFGRLWAELNPGWAVRQWTDKDIPDLLKPFSDLETVAEDLLRRDGGRGGVELYVQLADVIGYVLLQQFGGVYVNCDMQPVQPLPELPNKAWASYENTVDGRIVNAAIGAPRPHDPFWSRLLKELPHSYHTRPGAEMVETTGPGLLTDVAHKYPELLHVYPVETFNPVHWKQIREGGDASHWADGRDWSGTSTIAVHHWGHKKFTTGGNLRSNTVETATQ